MADPRHTFVFADLSGYTALTEAHGDDAAADTVEQFCAFACERLDARGAERVKGIGDALMLRCEDAADGLRLGVELVWGIGRRHGFPRVRVGVHTGPAVRRRGDWFGAAVNLAARIADAAEGGHLLCSQATAEAATADSALLLTAARVRTFKNVGDPVALWEVTPVGLDIEGVWPVDPVCRMVVDPAQANDRLVVEGVTVVFCSPACAARYARLRGAPAAATP